MKLLTCSALGLALALVAGCQKTTTTAPATPSTPKTTQTPDNTTPPVVRNDKDVKKLTMIAAKDHSIEQGETDKVMVTITRSNFDDPVKISLNNLPRGVELLDANTIIQKGDNSVTLTLKASPDAEVGEFSVALNAEAPGIPANTQTFKLKVEAAN